MRSSLSVLMLAAVAACSDATAPVQPPAATYVKLSLARATSGTPRVAGLVFDLGPNDSVNPGSNVPVLLAATEVPAGTQGAMLLTAAMPTVVGIKQDGVLIDPLSFTPGDTVPYLWTAPTTVGQHTLVGDYVDASGAHQTVGTITIAVRDTTTPVDTMWTITAAWDSVEVPRSTGGPAPWQLAYNLIPVLHEWHNGMQAAYYRLDYLTASGYGQPLQVDSLPAGCSDAPWNGAIYCDAGSEGRIVVTVPAGLEPWVDMSVLTGVAPRLQLPAPGATLGFWLHAGTATDITAPPCTRCE